MPKWFIKMGEEDWGFNHSVLADLELSLHADKERPAFNFLEPVMVELRLRNVGKEPRRLDAGVLHDACHTVLAIQKGDGPVKVLRPFHRDCVIPREVALRPGEVMSRTVFLSADVGGWKIDEPGQYNILALTEVNGEEVFSAPLSIRITYPGSREEDILAQDYFSDRSRESCITAEANS